MDNSYCYLCIFNKQFSFNTSVLTAAFLELVPDNSHNLNINWYYMYSLSEDVWNEWTLIKSIFIIPGKCCVNTTFSARNTAHESIATSGAYCIKRLPEKKLG